ncbi:low temperature requirement protein A [Micromonospora sp. NPDC049523]|uniref:low temperature requirement protein A n=1 Tax=Micromonospora sp. NPDC049523 TaxID=3155921 RepID=UPI003447CBEB
MTEGAGTEAGTGTPEAKRRHAERLQAGMADRPGLPELFFDLVYVFALIHLMRIVANDLTWRRAGEMVVLGLALSLIWVMTVWLGELVKPDRPVVMAQLFVVMAGSLLLAAAASDAYDERGLVFAVIYVTIHLGSGLYYQVALRPSAQKHAGRRILLWEGVAAVAWIVGGVLTGTGRWVSWVVAVAIEYLGAALTWPAPWSAEPLHRTERLTAERITERYRQFIILALGVSLFAVGEEFSQSTYDVSHIVALVVAFLLVALTWRIYICRAGALMTTIFATAERPFRLSRLTAVAHLIMVGAIIGIALTNKLVIRRPTSETPTALSIIILGSPALFLIGRALLEKVLFGQLSWTQLLGFPVLAGLAVVVPLVSPVTLALLVAALLALIVVLDLYYAPSRALLPPSEA